MKHETYDELLLPPCSSSLPPSQVAVDHDATVKSREEELKVIAQAKQILVDTTSGAVEQTYSFLQLRAGSDLAGAEAINLVKKLARDQNSMALAQLASRMAAIMKYGAANGDDPFAKVKGHPIV